MELKILFDYRSIDNKLHIGWGISVIVDGGVLFDTGENGEWLMDNLKHMRVDIENIESVVISHNHWDHTGGLWKLLKHKDKLKVYGCANFDKVFKKKIRSLGGNMIEVAGDNPNKIKISKNIYSSGEILGKYDNSDIAEQALVIESGKGLVVITGCAHPGIINILENIKERFNGKKMYFVMGGFHLMNMYQRRIKFIIKEFRTIGIKKVGPTHCSGKEAEDMFKKEYQNDYIDIKAGKVIKI